MTVGSRRFAARCRDRFVTDPTTHANTTEPTQPEPPTTMSGADVDESAAQENVDTVT